MISLSTRRSLDSHGFTIPELIIVMALTIFMTMLVIGFSLDLWSSTATLQSDSETFVSRQDSGDALRDSLNTSAGLINQNGIPDTNTNNPDPADGSGTHWLLMHAIPTTVTIPAAGTTTPLFYFQSPSVDTSKNFIMNGVQSHKDEFILYLDGSTKRLMQRTLVNPSASGNRLVTTCPPAAASASCPADKTMANEVSKVDVRYFSRSGNLIDHTSIVDSTTGAYIGPDFPSVEVVEMTIHGFRKSKLHGGTDTSNQTTIRVALRND